MAAERTAKVSIGIPVFNGEATIRRCLESLVVQDMADLEVLISDNCSTDRTYEICREYAARDPRIAVVRQERNLGMVGNYYFVFHNTAAPHFMWLHDDDYYESPAYVSRLFAEARSGAYALVFPAIRKFTVLDGRPKPLAARGADLAGSRYERHRAMMRGHYLGYQVAYGMASREVLAATLSLWFRSTYLGGIPDEEPYLHFLLSRFETRYVPEATYCKDMSTSNYAALGFARTVVPIFWQSVATAGVIAQSDYTSGQKAWLIVLKALRSAYVLADLAWQSFAGLFRRPAASTGAAK